MRPILPDTNAYSAFMLGTAEIIEVVAHAEQLYVSSVVLGELLAGFSVGTRAAKNRAELARFLESPRVEILPITARTADSYALIYTSLRRKGRPIPTNDLWIAAGALEHGAAVLTRDVHFSQIEGLLVGQRMDDFLP